MPQLNPYSAFKRLVAVDKTAQAIDLLKKHIRDHADEGELLIQEARLNATERALRLNQISRDEYDREKTKIRASIIDLSTQIFEKKTSEASLFLRFLLLLLPVLAYAVFNYFWEPDKTHIEQNLPKESAEEDSIGDQSPPQEIYSQPPKLNKDDGKNRGSIVTHHSADIIEEENPQPVLPPSMVIENVTLRGIVYNKQRKPQMGVQLRTIHGQSAHTDSSGLFSLKINVLDYPSGSLFLYYQIGSAQGTKKVSTQYGTNDIEINLNQ